MHRDIPLDNVPNGVPLLQLRPENCFRVTRRVAWSDSDPAGAYTFVSALRYAEDAEVGLLRNVGLLNLLYPHLPRVYVAVQYRTPAHFDDEIQVLIAISQIGTSSIHFVFEITRGNETCAEGRYGASFLSDLGKPQPIPAEAREILLPYVLPNRKDSINRAELRL